MEDIRDRLRVVGKKLESSTTDSSETLKRPVELDFSGLQRQVGLMGSLVGHSFDSWDEHRQQAALIICLDFFEGPTSLVFWSKAYGSGKTFAAAAILNEWLRRDVHRKRMLPGGTEIPCYYHDGGMILPNGQAWEVAGLFVKMQSFLSQLKSKLPDRGDEAWQMVAMLQKTPLLVMDDLCRAEPTDFENDVIYRIVDFRGNMGLPFIATTNASPSELGRWLWGATASRLKSARFVHFDEVDYRG